MAQDLVDYADNNGADLLVLGTHGRTGLMHLLMGSFAETVMRQSHLASADYPQQSRRSIIKH